MTTYRFLAVLVLLLAFLALSACATPAQAPAASPTASPVFAIPTLAATIIAAPTRSPASPTPSPTPALAVSTERFALAAGAAHTCLLIDTGLVRCWGANQFGQLGGGSGHLAALQNAPSTDVANLSDWLVADLLALPDEAIAIAAGAYHSCALTAGGAVLCWGQNVEGQLGDGTTIDSDIPLAVQGLSGDMIAITAGAAHTCALLAAGIVECWGANANGQLGDSSSASSSLPVAVQGLSGVQQVVAGVAFTCALKKDGAIFCWGDGSNGLFSPNASSAPLRLGGLRAGITAIAAGQYHLCALIGEQEVDCWGALSSERAYTSSSPQVVNIDSPVTQMAAGGGHTCVLTAQGKVLCWGDNYFGQLGNASDPPTGSPVDVQGLGGQALNIASGSGHVCALIAGGAVKCWGDGSFGQLGDSTISWR